MKIFNTPHKKKSAVITLFSGLSLFFIFFFFGLKYLDPPIVYGMEISFGVSDKGGFIEEKKIIQSVIEDEIIEEIKENESQLSDSKNVLVEKESIISVDNKTQNKEQNLTENKAIVNENQDPEIDSNTKSILSNLVNQKGINKNINPPIGADNTQNTKGLNSGNPYINTYLNIEGFKDLKNGYGLNGRNLKSNGSVVQQCNEEGIVVVRIIVDRKGKVIEAKPGVKGSTNIHPCLLKPATETALLHEWYPDQKAPSKQIGFVVINFKIRK